MRRIGVRAGDGDLRDLQRRGLDPEREPTCPGCGGKGEVQGKRTCPLCGGSGTVEKPAADEG